MQTVGLVDSALFTAALPNALKPRQRSREAHRPSALVATWNPRQLLETTARVSTPGSVPLVASLQPEQPRRRRPALALRWARTRGRSREPRRVVLRPTIRDTAAHIWRSGRKSE